MKGECFFVPGSTEKSWNQTAPATRILVRQDLFDQVEPLFLSYVRRSSLSTMTLVQPGRLHALRTMPL